jgi:YHS domain-containing protein
MSQALRHFLLDSFLRRALLLAAVVLLPGCGTVQNVVADGADSRLMLRGNDPVAFFTEGKAVRGKPEIKADHDGLTYRFASDANRAAFQQNPQKYLPAYAGFCASGAPYALKANIGADIFKIVDGRLYLFGSERARRHWEMDEKKNVELGDWYWENESRGVPFRIQNLKRYVVRVPHYKSDEQLEAEWQARFGKKQGG